MFTIKHDVDSFTIIDCNMPPEDRDWILKELKNQANGKGIRRFISTHPHQDHIWGLKYLDQTMEFFNFYCVNNEATKPDETDDFKHYCKLRDSDKAFFISKGRSRKWLNESNEERGSAGIEILWPDLTNPEYKAALNDAKMGKDPNNISPIIKYSLKNSGSFLWMGDLETDFMEAIKDEVNWPNVDILFAPHHGRESGNIPGNILSKIAPKIIIIGEAPSKHLNYYRNYNKITQNSAGMIAFECVENQIHIYVSNTGYQVNFLEYYRGNSKNYIGTLVV